MQVTVPGIIWVKPASVMVSLITPPIHRGVNILAYKYKMKDVPW